MSLRPSSVHVPSFDNPLPDCVRPLIDPPLARKYARKRMITGAALAETSAATREIIGAV